jgi:Ala-tRNA(Pro) deacylase
MEDVMPLSRIKDYLDSQGVKYDVISHAQAYTAQKTAAAAHISGKELAKAVIVKLDGKIAMAVLPGSSKIDFEMLSHVTGAKNVQLATEREFEDLFPDCEMGAMPPFGNLYDMDVYVAESLADDLEIAFNACSHRELIRLRYDDFERLVSPKRGAFARGMSPIV